MKKVLSILLVLGLVMVLAVPAQAASTTTTTTTTTSTSGSLLEDYNSQEAMNKLGRGFMNILDAVCEIPGTMMRVSKAEGWEMGWSKGLIVGAGNAAVRTSAGVIEIATFPLPVPPNYEPMLDEPQFLNAD